MYIKFSRASEAARAVEEMNGKYLNNYQKRPMRVFISGCKSQINRTQPNSELHDKMHKIIVCVEKNITQTDLKNYFRVCDSSKNISFFLQK